MGVGNHDRGRYERRRTGLHAPAVQLPGRGIGNPREEFAGIPLARKVVESCHDVFVGPPGGFRKANEEIALYGGVLELESLVDCVFPTALRARGQTRLRANVGKPPVPHRRTRRPPLQCNIQCHGMSPWLATSKVSLCNSARRARRCCVPIGSRRPSSVLKSVSKVAENRAGLPPPL